jgi:uncharacterized repeat protein (TIGR01451 family)
VLPSIGALLLALAGAAQASTTLGDTTGATDSCGGPESIVQTATAGPPSYIASSSGVITSWNYKAGATPASVKLKVYTPENDPSFWNLRSESAQKAVGAAPDQIHANQLNTFAQSPGLPIASGDHLGLTQIGTSGAIACIQPTSSTADTIRVKNPPDTTPGHNTGFLGVQTKVKIGVSVVVEPDADGDSFGDETQDSCPTDATVHTGPCPVDVAIVKAASANPVLGNDLTYTLTVTNNHPTNPADGVSAIDPLPAGVTFVSSAAGQGSCSGTTTVSCSLGTLAHGQSTTVTIVVRPTSTGPLSNTASVTTTSSETDTSNNSSTASVTVAAPPPPPAPVLSAFKLAPASFKAKNGTLVSYVLTQDATTTFKVSKRVRGVKKGKRCVAPPKKKPKKKPKGCTRLVAVSGSIVRPDAAGPVSFRFKGKLGTKTLGPGKYRLRAVARNVSGASKPASANFTIKK